MSNKNTKTKKYYVNGMHCSSCELIIKQDVKKIEGIENAEVSLSKSHLIVNAKSPKLFPKKETLNKMFKELGYTFHDNEVSKSKLDRSDVGKVLLLVLAFVVLFYFLEGSGIFMKLSVTPQSSVSSYFLFGLAAGLSSCAALVGGLLLSLSKNWNAMYGNNRKKSIQPFLYFNASRIIAFTLLGGLLGYLGSFFTVSMEFSSILTFAIAILMLILGFQMLGVSWFQRFSFNFLGNNKYLDKNSNLQGKYVPIIVGAMTFLIPCGFTLIAQSNVLTSGSFVNGALKLLAFSLGTLPMLALISFSSVKFFSKPEFSKKFSLFAGALIIFFAFYTINSQLNVLGVFSLSDIRIAKETKATSTKKVSNNNLVDSEGYQTMQMEASGFEYFPKELYINANTKTRWEIYNSGAVGCASAVYGRGLYSKVINLKPGLNTVEFVSPESGTYKVSCSMGMVAPITVNVL